MRLALALVLAAATSRPGCDFRSPAPFEPCGGKSCGASCAVCPPGAADCAETAELKACDAQGRCVSATPDLLCPAADACAGKVCGDACLVSLPCHFAEPPCLAPQQPGHCDVTGACLPGDVGTCEPHPDCVGKPCGAECNPCGPDTVCPTLIPSACDRFGRCAGDVPGICYDPCEGKRCGDACTLCAPEATGCVETMELKACDTAGQCVSRTTPFVCG